MAPLPNEESPKLKVDTRQKPPQAIGWDSSQVKKIGRAHV